MRIAGQSTIAATERALDVLAKAAPGEPLKLPSNPRHLAGGAEASLAQLVISWAQKNRGTALETYIETEAQIEDFVRRMPGLIAAPGTAQAGTASS